MVFLELFPISTIDYFVDDHISYITFKIKRDFGNFSIHYIVADGH